MVLKLKRRIGMKIITILGSPKKSGNTAKVLSMFEEKVGENHEVEGFTSPSTRWAAALDAISARKKRMSPDAFKKMMH